MNIEMKKVKEELEEIFKVKEMIYEVFDANNISVRIGMLAMLHLIAQIVAHAPSTQDALYPTLQALIANYEEIRKGH